jgi:hypothetical protein
MKYMLLVHHNEDVLNALSEIERRDMLEESVRLANHLYAMGQYIHASPLYPVASATTIQVRDGKSIVTDGPFAETREQLGGYFLIEAMDLDEAIGIARRIPGARIGTVEIRPVKDVDGLPE